jgi:branched-chain amino acid transport system substrate-binding protein
MSFVLWTIKIIKIRRSKMLNRKVKAVSCVICTLVLLLFSAGIGKAEPVVKEWRIPVIIFLSGPVSADGVMYKWVTEQVAADINKAGGIAGKPFVPVFLDSAFDPSKATAAVASAIDMKAVAMIGPLNDMECKAAMPLAVREGIFSFSGSCTADVAKQFNPWIIYAGGTIEDITKSYMPQWFKKEANIKHVVTFIEPIFPMLYDIARGNEKTLGKLGAKSTIIEVAPGKVDYSPFVLKAMNSGADAFTFLTTQATTAKLVKDLVRQKVPTNRMWVWILGAGPAFFGETKDISEGIYTISSETWAFTPKWVELDKRYRKDQKGKPLFFMSYMIHDMIYMLKDAIEKQGITGDPAKLKEERIKIKDYALNQKGFKGLTANYDIENGQARHIPINLFKVKNQKADLIDVIIP